MPRTPDAPLRRTTLNLFEADCRWLEENYGAGWTTRLREHIHNEVESRKAFFGPDAKTSFIQPRTLGDLLK